MAVGSKGYRLKMAPLIDLKLKCKRGSVGDEVVRRAHAKFSVERISYGFL